MIHIYLRIKEDTFFFGVVKIHDSKQCWALFLTPGRHSYTVSLFPGIVKILRYGTWYPQKQKHISFCVTTNGKHVDGQKCCSWPPWMCPSRLCRGLIFFWRIHFSSIFPTQYWGVVIQVLTCFNRRSWTWNEGSIKSQQFHNNKAGEQRVKDKLIIFFQRLDAGMIRISGIFSRPRTVSLEPMAPDLLEVRWWWEVIELVMKTKIEWGAKDKKQSPSFIEHILHFSFHLVRICECYVLL